MFKNLKKKAQEAAASAKDAAASASTAVASATQNATQQVSGKMNNISSSGMSDKQISAKLYEYLVGNDEEKFDVLAEHSLRSNNLPDDQKKSKTRFVFHKWSENPLKMPLLLAAVYYNNHKIVKIMLKYKDMFDINQEVDKKTALYMLRDIFFVISLLDCFFLFLFFFGLGNILTCLFFFLLCFLQGSCL